MSRDAILTDLWAIHFWRDPKAADAPDGDDDFDETLRELGLDDPDQWEAA